MGCASGKLENSKLSYSPSIINGSDMKIQSVLKLRPNSRTKKTHSSGHHRRKSDSKATSENVSRRSPRKRTRNENPLKANCDARITAKYNIKALIGKGTFSRVLRVEHRITKQPYALKMIESPNGRDVFEAELSILRRVNHPNVIKLVEVFESNNKVYMVMELATGGNLLDRLESKGTFSEDVARNVMQMVLSGVKYLHTLGITHRDLKPDNLLYYHPGNESKLIITDFGLASTRKASGSPYMHTICGTPQYIAPEIVAQRPYTCAVDMWAVGVISYIILFGAFPFDAELDAQIFKLILKGKINVIDTVWREFSKEAKSFVLELLQHNPSERLTASQAVQHKWLTAAQLSYSPDSARSRKSSSPEHDRSQRSSRSVGSSKSGKSVSSLRSGHHRVQLHHLEALSLDPEVAAALT